MWGRYGCLNRREKGREKEELACRYLEQKGYRIMAKNYWCRQAEIDIVAMDGDELVFVEVKYRKNEEFGGGLSAVSPKKIRSICKCARYYIYRENIDPDMPVRFDVIAVDGNRIIHLDNAFETEW